MNRIFLTALASVAGLPIAFGGAFESLGDGRRGVTMDALPFAASFDALAFIVKHIRLAVREPEIAGLVPALFYCCNSTAWEKETGRLTESILYGHYEIGWYRPEQVTDFVEVRILGVRIFIDNKTLNKLVGKQLVLRIVDPGGRSKPGADRKVLVAVSRAGAETQS
jgi:hypothetical protein